MVNATVSAALSASAKITSQPGSWRTHSCVERRDSSLRLCPLRHRASEGQEWHADETAESLIRSGAIQPVIMVGIYNTGPRRIDEYTPTTDVHGHSGGKAHLYAAMILDELMPFIDARYRTLAAREHT